MKRFVFLLAVALLAASTHPELPDPKLTPGVTDPAVTQATIKTTVCQDHYTSGVRDVTEAEKKEVMQRYGLALTELSKVEIDHFFSLEIGGSNDIANLWPQYYEGPAGYLGAREKDVVETWLHRQVCAGKMTLPQAQKAIHAWPQVYQKIKR